MRRVFILFLFVFTSCFDEGVFHDDRLVYYAENVQSGLSDNGVFIDINNVSLIIEKGLSYDGAWGRSKGNSVYIDEGIFYRKTQGSLSGHIQIEMLLLHEIGHNLLGLKHWESSNDWPHEGYQVMQTGTWQKITDENSKDLCYKNLSLYFNMR